jgi:glycosyltransferase involved in cell wall biosynthesis
VVALHDISFVARPEWFHWREGLRRRVLAKRAANAARTVITISEFSKQEIVTRLGVPAARVRVVPPGIDVPACDDAGQRTDSAQLLYVGSIFNRRHVTELIAAFDRMAGRHPDATLHIVGDNRTYPHQDIAASIDRRPTAARIHWHRYVPEAELRRLYGGARGFVFLSEYEGLGLTPLEALSVGVPCLLLDTPVARESCGDAALYVDADVDAISASLERLLYDGPTRTALLDAAPAAVARYDWPRAARDTLAVLEEAR